MNTNLGSVTPDEIRTAYSGGKLADDQIDLLCWLLAHAKRQKPAWSYADIAKAVGRSTTTWSRVMRGVYTGDLQSVLSELEFWHQLQRDRAARGTAGFIETSLTRRIFDTCDQALSMQRIRFIWGASHIGKTEALREYRRRNNHGRTLLIRCPSVGGRAAFVSRLSREAGVGNAAKNATQLSERILSNITERQLLIVDEAHEPLLVGGPTTALAIYEFVREIRDTTGCGLVICGTNVLRDAVHSGPISKPMSQFIRRGLAGAEVQLEDQPLWSDLRRFWESYQLPELKPTSATGKLIRALVTTDALGSFCAYLQEGSLLAHSKGETYNWPHFMDAYNSALAGARPPQEVDFLA